VTITAEYQPNRIEYQPITAKRQQNARTKDKTRCFYSYRGAHLLSNDEGKEVTKMTQKEIVLDLQGLDIPEEVDFFGNSGTSSPGGCCNGKEEA
jgi:hypothetical protein